MRIEDRPFNTFECMVVNMRSQPLDERHPKLCGHGLGYVTPVPLLTLVQYPVAHSRAAIPVVLILMRDALGALVKVRLPLDWYVRAVEAVGNHHHNQADSECQLSKHLPAARGIQSPI